MADGSPILRSPARFADDSARHLATLAWFADDLDAFAAITKDQTSDTLPFWENGWFPTTDAVALCGFLKAKRPARYIEVGSGNSTKFARWWIDLLGLPTKIISIDPAPANEVDELCDEVHRTTLEAIDLERLAIAPDDMVFMDSSHRAEQGSDVTQFFREILPAMPAGVVYGLHDIFLPSDYPAEWRERGYNEQYLLDAWIMGGAGGGSVEMPVAWLCEKHAAIVADLHTPLSEAGVWAGGAAFFLRR